MPFLINGKELDLREAGKSKDNDDVVNYILKQIDAVDEKLPAQFTFIPRYNKPNPADRSSIDRKGMFGIGMKAIYKGGKTAVEVTYYETVQFGARGEKIYLLNDGGRHIKFTGNLVVQKGNAELAVWLFGLIKGDFELITFNKEVPIMHVDYKAIAKSEMDKIMDKARIDQLVLFDIKKDQLDTIAKSIGVEVVDSLTNDQKRLAIYKLVQSSREIEKQVREALNPNPTTDLKVKIQDALDKDYIRSETAGNFYAYFAYKGGTKDRELMRKGIKTKSIDALHDFFAKSSVEQEYLDQLIKQEENKTEE